VPDETCDGVEIDLAGRWDDCKKVAVFAFHQDTLGKVVLWNVTDVCGIGGVECALMRYDIVRTSPSVEVLL
jgi:hypothetical protein